jgi:hypothetical protein
MTQRQKIDIRVTLEGSLEFFVDELSISVMDIPAADEFIMKLLSLRLEMKNGR